MLLRKQGRRILFVTVITMALTVSFAAWGSGLEDSDSVEIQALVQGAMQVDAEEQVIDLGALAPNVAFEVPADGSGDYEVATFVITGPSGLDWRIDIDWNDLQHETLGDTILITPPSGDAICFDPDSGSQCIVGMNSGDTLDKGDHEGDGQANVGYHVEVPEGASEGSYSNAEAIVLTAEALLGT